jgi:hypothetical protein
MKGEKVQLNFGATTLDQTTTNLTTPSLVAKIVTLSIITASTSIESQVICYVGMLVG